SQTLLQKTFSALTAFAIFTMFSFCTIYNMDATLDTVRDFKKQKTMAFDHRFFLFNDNGNFQKSENRHPVGRNIR
ncbi:MAG: hypothetical protein Q4D98_08610, partial [Planctomycetia bacterium]|nr:hypothetical protein [Planctomycetia bacterium]